MFGYVTVNQPELKIKDYEQYHSFYCGLCRCLDRRYGTSGRTTLTYDMTFLAVLLTGLYEPETSVTYRRCMMHPSRKHQERTNVYTEYCADMNILLSYKKMQDDWEDEKKPLGLFGRWWLRRAYRKAFQRYPEKADRIEQLLGEIRECEKRLEPNIDTASGLFGELTAELFLYREDEWKQELHQMGFYLGKFIYLMDACEDLEDDRKTGNYNPFLASHIPEAELEEQCRSILMMMMAECARAFERLPIIEYVDILRNIIYTGVWTKYYVSHSLGKEETYVQ